jgi:hypothetical protein
VAAAEPDNGGRGAGLMFYRAVSDRGRAQPNVKLRDLVAL